MKQIIQMLDNVLKIVQNSMDTMNQVHNVSKNVKTVILILILSNVLLAVVHQHVIMLTERVKWFVDKKVIIISTLLTMFKHKSVIM